jgi:hypothetical protein
MPKRKIKIVCLETGEEYPSAVDLARDIGCAQAQVSRATRSGHALHGLHYYRLDDYPDGPPPAGFVAVRGEPVECFETGETFGSAADAARRFGVRAARIRHAVASGGEVAGFRFCRPGGQPVPRDPDPRLRPVVRIDDGERWPSHAALARELGVTGEAVRDAIERGGTLRGGRYCHEEDFPAAAQDGRGGPIDDAE